MQSDDDDRPRVRASGRNGSRLPLRMPGERIGGRKKGTPNKNTTLCEIEAAMLATADAIGKPKGVGKIWVATGEGGVQGFLAWMLENYPVVCFQMLVNSMELEEPALKRSHNRARASFNREFLKFLMLPVELKPSHKTAHPSCVLELADLLTHSVASQFQI
jgi:hypothetical protein